MAGSVPPPEACIYLLIVRISIYVRYAGLVLGAPPVYTPGCLRSPTRGCLRGDQRQAHSPAYDTHVQFFASLTLYECTAAVVYSSTGRSTWYSSSSICNPIAVAVVAVVQHTAKISPNVRWCSWARGAQEEFRSCMFCLYCRLYAMTHCVRSAMVLLRGRMTLHISWSTSTASLCFSTPLELLQKA